MLAAGDACPDQSPIEAEIFHGIKADGGIPGGFKNDVRATGAGQQLFDRRLAGADVVCAVRFGNFLF